MNKIQKIDTFVFDLDGTLIDSGPDITAAINRFLSKQNFPLVNVDTVEKYLGDGPLALVSGVLSSLNARVDDGFLKKACNTYLAYYSENPVSHTEFFPYVKDDLETLKNIGFHLAICTNKTQSMAEKVLGGLGISHLFDVVVGADSVENCKPDGGHLLAVLSAMGVKKEQSLYIGDTMVDVKTAQNAGVDMRLVEWGGGNEIKNPIYKRIDRLLCLKDVNEK